MTSSHNNELNTLRSGILRCLLRRDKYVVSPGIYFALLGFSFSLPTILSRYGWYYHHLAYFAFK